MPAASPGAHNKPFSPSSMISPMPPAVEATTGRPFAIASRMTIGMPSPYRLGSTKADKPASSPYTSRVWPTQSMASATPSRVARASIALRYASVSKPPIRRSRAGPSHVDRNVAKASTRTSRPLRGRNSAAEPTVNTSVAWASRPCSRGHPVRNYADDTLRYPDTERILFRVPGDRQGQVDLPGTQPLDRGIDVIPEAVLGIPEQ